MEELVNLLGMTQKELKEFLYEYLKKKDMNPLSKDGFLYAEGDIPIMLVAHMDTVALEPPTNLCYSKELDLIYNRDGILGGDDRCGVYAIMKLLEKYRPFILFTGNEEIGGEGAYQAVELLDKPDVKYIVEFDRNGVNDCVFYNCGNKKFKKYIEKFGFITEIGSFSDISILGPEWDIATVNLSCGYFDEHTKNEYVFFSILENLIKTAEIMINQIDKAPYFNYQYKVSDKSKEFKFFTQDAMVKKIGGIR
jgi:di/tripeptidase